MSSEGIFLFIIIILNHPHIADFNLSVSKNIYNNLFCENAPKTWQLTNINMRNMHTRWTHFGRVENQLGLLKSKQINKWVNL